MNISNRAFFSFVLASFLLVGCGGDQDDGTGRSGGNLIDPTDPNALSEVLIIPGAVRVDGAPPEASSDPSAPMISGGGELETLSGDQAVLEVTYESPSGYTECYVQVIGADGYFVIDVPSQATEGTIQIPVNIPENVDSGAFDLYTCIVGDNGFVSNAVATTVGVTYPGGNPGGGNVVCASDDPSVGATLTCPNGSMLDFCIDVNSGSCYYTVGGQQVNCGNCQENSGVVEACVQQAVQLCI